MEAILARNTARNLQDYVAPKAIRGTGVGNTAPTVFIIDGDFAVRLSLEIPHSNCGLTMEFVVNDRGLNSCRWCFSARAAACGDARVEQAADVALAFSSKKRRLTPAGDRRGLVR